jgi:hypothetical protein
MGSLQQTEVRVQFPTVISGKLSTNTAQSRNHEMLVIQVSR